MSAWSVVVVGIVVGMFIYLCVRLASAAWYRRKLDVIKEMSRERTERGEHRKDGQEDINRPLLNKRYIGDGVQVLYHGNGSWLYPNDLEKPSDTIYLEPEVLGRLSGGDSMRKS